MVKALYLLGTRATVSLSTSTRRYSIIVILCYNHSLILFRTEIQQNRFLQKKKILRTYYHFQNIPD